ncbi:MAG: hypothetical protein EOM67_14095, partial [Spirochaetia bacterium]|nr:hypothetical protein [Spirochaetia bacterium]
MKRIERLKRVVSEARDTASYDSSRIRHGIPSPVLKQILRSEWRLSNFRDWDMSKNELIFQTGSVSNVSGTSAEDLSGSDVYTSVKINDTGDVESITVMLVESMRWFKREGPSATYT